MAMCDACAAVVQRRRGFPAHAYLSLVKTVEPAPTRSGMAKSSLSYFTCRRCETKWRYEDNKSDEQAGWTVEP